jgi:hypothetical protein
VLRIVSTPSVPLRAVLLTLLKLPDHERARRIGEFYGDPRTQAVREAPDRPRGVASRAGRRTRRATGAGAARRVLKGGDAPFAGPSLSSSGTVLRCVPTIDGLCGPGRSYYDWFGNVVTAQLPFVSPAPPDPSLASRATLSTARWSGHRSSSGTDAAATTLGDLGEGSAECVAARRPPFGAVVVCQARRWC